MLAVGGSDGAAGAAGAAGAPLAELVGWGLAPSVETTPGTRGRRRGEGVGGGEGEVAAERACWSG